MYGTAPFRPQCTFPALRHVSILALPTSLNVLCTVVVQREEEVKKEEEIVERKGDNPSNSSIRASYVSVDEKKNEAENEKEEFRKEKEVRGTTVCHACPPLASEETDHVKETDIHDAPNDFLSSSLFSSPLETIPKKQPDHMTSALEEQENEEKMEMECKKSSSPFCCVPPTPTCSRISYHSSSFLFSYSFWTSGIYFEIHRPRYVPSSGHSRRRERRGKHVRDREDDEEKEVNACTIDIHDEGNEIVQEGGCVVLFRSAIRRYTAQPSWELPPSFLRSWRQERKRRGDTLPSSSPPAQPKEASSSTTTDKDFRFSSSTSSFSAIHQRSEEEEETKVEEEGIRRLPPSLQFYSSMMGEGHSRRESRRRERVKKKHSLSPTTTTSSNAPPSLPTKTSDCRTESDEKKKEAIQKEQIHLVFYGILADSHPVPPPASRLSFSCPRPSAFDSPSHCPEQQQQQQRDGSPASGKECVGDGSCSLCASCVRRGFPIWSVSLHPMDLTFLGTSLHASSPVLLRQPLSPPQPSVLSLPQDTWKGEGEEEKSAAGTKTTLATRGTDSVTSVTTIQTPTKNDNAQDEMEEVQPRIDPPHPHHSFASSVPRRSDAYDGRERVPCVRYPKCFYGCFLPFLPSSAAQHPTAFLAPTIRLLLGYEKNDECRTKERDDNEKPKWFTTSTRWSSLPFLDISSASLHSNTSSSPPPHFLSLRHHWRFWCATSVWHSPHAAQKKKRAASHTHAMKEVASPPFANGFSSPSCSSPPMTCSNATEETNDGKGEEEKAIKEKQKEWSRWLAGPSLLPPSPSPASSSSPSPLSRREGFVSPLSIRSSSSSDSPTLLWNRQAYSYHFFPSFALLCTSLAPPLPYRCTTVDGAAVPHAPSSPDGGCRLRRDGTVASWHSPSSSTMTVPLEAIWRRVAQRFFDASLLEMGTPQKSGGRPCSRKKRCHGRGRKKRETKQKQRRVQEKDHQTKKEETANIDEKTSKETSKGHAMQQNGKREQEEKKCQERHCISTSPIPTSSFAFSRCKDILWRRLQRSQENQAKWCSSLAVLKKEVKALEQRRHEMGTPKAGENHFFLLPRPQQKEEKAPRTSFGCASSSPVANPALVSAVHSFHRWDGTYTDVLRQQLESSRRWLPVVRRQVVKELSHIWFPLTFSAHYRILSPLTREDARASVLPASVPPYADASRNPKEVNGGRHGAGGEQKRENLDSTRLQPIGRVSLFSLFSSSSLSAEQRRHQNESLFSTVDASTEDFSRRCAAKDRISHLSLPCLPSWSTLVALATATLMPASSPSSGPMHEEGRKLPEKEKSVRRQGKDERKHESDGATALVLPSSSHASSVASSFPSSLPIRPALGRSLRPFSAAYHPQDDEKVDASMTSTRVRRPRTPTLSSSSPSFGWHSSLLYPQDEKEFCVERQGLEKYCQALVQLAHVCHVTLPYPLLVGGGGVGVVIFAAPENWSCAPFHKEVEDRPLLTSWREKSASATPTPTATHPSLPTKKEDLSSLLCLSCASSSTVLHLDPLYLSGAPECMPELIRMAQNGSSLSSFFLSPASCTSIHSYPNGCYTQGEMAKKKNSSLSATTEGVEAHSGNVWRKADVSAIELEQQRLVFGRLLLIENGRALGKAIGVPDSVLSSCDSRLAALLQTLFRAAE